jgi:hypothetical protein
MLVAFAAAAAAIKACGRACFAAEPLLECLVLGEMREQRLDCHRPIDNGVAGTPYLAHPTPTEQLYEAVPPKRCAIHLFLPGKCRRASP